MKSDLVLKKQTNDLLDELLAIIPTNKRTNRVLNGIHTMIERYEQLREMFSKFDKEGLAIDIIKKEGRLQTFSSIISKFK